MASARPLQLVQWDLIRPLARFAARAARAWARRRGWGLGAAREASFVIDDKRVGNAKGRSTLHSSALPSATSFASRTASIGRIVPPADRRTADQSHLDCMADAALNDVANRSAIALRVSAS